MPFHWWSSIAAIRTMPSRHGNSPDGATYRPLPARPGQRKIRSRALGQRAGEDRGFLGRHVDVHRSAVTAGAIDAVQRSQRRDGADGAQGDEPGR